MREPATFRGVPAGALEDVDERAWAHVARALVRGRAPLDLAAVADACEAREMQLWLAERNGRIVGAVVTQIADWPRWRTCHVMAAGWDDLSPEESRRCLDVLEAWARERGCGLIEVQGRRGWARRLPDYGPASLTLRKRLNAARAAKEEQS